MKLKSHGRPLRKLRLQLLDACNYRCTYCMPQNPVFQPANRWVDPEEICRIVGELHQRGVDELRLTGGEPLLRPEIIDIAENLSSLKWKKFGVTTNGERLSEFLPEFHRNTKVDNFNISIDSLDPDHFKAITGRGNLEKVLESLHHALSLGYTVKVNVVVMRGKNDHELEAFADFAGSTGVEVRFLELMRIGPNHEDFGPLLVPSAELRQRLRHRHLRPVVSPLDNTATEFVCSDGARLGFISSETENFCGNCSRLRLTAQGELRPCLFKDEGTSLVGLHGQELDGALSRVLPQKPTGRLPHVDQPMYAIGG